MANIATQSLAPWMTSGPFSSTDYGGSQNLGANLLAQSGPTQQPMSTGQRLGLALLGAQQSGMVNASNRQKVIQGGVDTQDALLKQKFFQSMIARYMNGGQGAPQSQGMPQGAPQGMPASTPGVDPRAPAGIAAPQSPQGQAQGQPPNALGAPNQSQIFNQPVGGFDPGLLSAMTLINGGDPVALSAKLRAQQLLQAQQQYAPVIGKLDSVIKSASPAQMVAADPQLMATWQQMAPKLGYDPSKMTDSNVRQVLAYARNGIGTTLSEPAVAPPDVYKTTQQGLGQSYQTDQFGKISKGAPAVETAQFVTPNGIKLMSKAAGIAAGYTPFNPTTYVNTGAANSYASMVANYQVPPPSAYMMKTAQGMAVMAQVKALNPTYDAKKYVADQAALGQNTKLYTATSGYAETLDKNLDNLVSSYKKVDSSGSPLINRAYRAWQQGGAGDANTASMVTWLNAVQGEYAKLRSGSLGNAPASDASMRDAKEVINKNFNSGGIQAVAAAMRAEAQNRLQSIRDQSASLTGSGGSPMGGKTLTYDPNTGTFK